MVRLGAAKGDKLTPRSQQNPHLPSQHCSNTLPHSALPLNTLPLSWLSLPQVGFSSFLPTRQLPLKGVVLCHSGCHRPCARDLLVICEIWARKLLLAHWNVLGVTHHFSVFFVIPTDFCDGATPPPFLSSVIWEILVRPCPWKHHLSSAPPELSAPTNPNKVVFLMTSLGKYFSGLNGITFLFSHFQRKCQPKLWPGWDSYN